MGAVSLKEEVLGGLEQFLYLSTGYQPTLNSTLCHIPLEWLNTYFLSVRSTKPSLTFCLRLWSSQSCDLFLLLVSLVTRISKSATSFGQTSFHKKLEKTYKLGLDLLLIWLLFKFLSWLPKLNMIQEFMNFKYGMI